MARVRKVQGATAAAVAEVPATAGGVSGLELWDGGEIRASNLGPIRGTRLLGKITGPGLYLFVGANARGKSTLLSLMRKLQREKLLRAEANVTDGETSAFLELAAARVTFLRPTGQGVAEPHRDGVETLPPIESMPAPIQTLIDGGNMKGAEPRARARLEALLQYVPVEVTPARLDMLARALADLRKVEENPAAFEIAQRWLREAVSLGKVRGLANIQLHGADAERLHLSTLAAEGILDAQQQLLARLNAFGNAAEHALEIGRAEYVAATRRADEMLPRDVAGRPIGSPPSVAAAETRVRAARDRAAELRISRRARLEEERRREQLRGTLGPAPDLAALGEEVAAVQARLKAANAAVEAIETGGESLSVLTERDSAARRAHAAAMQALARSATRLFDETGPNDRKALAAAANLDSGFNADGEVPSGGFSPADVLADLVRFREIVESAAPQVEADAQLVLKCRLDCTDTQARIQTWTERFNAAAAEARSIAAEAVRVESEWAERRAESDRVASVQALLASPLTGATEAEVNVAEAEATEAEAELELAKRAERHAGALAEVTKAAAAVASVDALAAAYRNGAAMTWSALGEIVTDALAVPFLRVSGLDLLIGYLPDPFADAFRLAVNAAPSDPIEWRNIDDVDRISTAELHEAILRVMLRRREKLGGILILPWEVVAALDYDRKVAFAAEAKASGLVVLSERPRAKGEPEEVYLEKIGE